MNRAWVPDVPLKAYFFKFTFSYFLKFSAGKAFIDVLSKNQGSFIFRGKYKCVPRSVSVKDLFTFIGKSKDLSLFNTKK